MVLGSEGYFELGDYRSEDDWPACQNRMGHHGNGERWVGLDTILQSLFFSMAACLKTLIQMREGRTWTFGLQPNMIETVSSFTADLMNEGLVQKILDVLVTTGMI